MPYPIPHADACDMDKDRGATSDDQRWRSRPILAGALRCLLLAIPFVASSGATLLVNRVLPPGAGRSAWGLTTLLVVALVVAIAVERGARRVLPIALLLKLSMIFPDRAPSRFKLARAAACRPAKTELLFRGPAAEPLSTTDLVLHLVAALGAHDRRTRGHSERVRLLCDMLAEELKLDQAARDRLRWSALLHDIGKMRVSSAILNKPGPLDKREFEVIKLHPAAGAELAAPLMPWLGEWGAGIVDHHEKYDGSGYPAGKSGLEISLAGRLIGLIDAFETMTAARPYKKAMATKAAREELARCAGAHFDPIMVRAFLALSLPRVLWAMGPLSFLFQVPFLRPLAEAGIRTGALAPQAAAAALATGAAGAAVLVSGLAPGIATTGAAQMTAGGITSSPQSQLLLPDARDEEPSTSTRAADEPAASPEERAQVATAAPADQAPPTNRPGSSVGQPGRTEASADDGTVVPGSSEPSGPATGAGSPTGGGVPAGAPAQAPAAEPADAPAPAEEPSVAKPAAEQETPPAEIQVPEIQPRTSQPLADQPPATEPAAEQRSATETPATEPPASQPPAEQPPAAEPTALEPAATQLPETQPPATETPATEPPTEQTPVTEPPALEPAATQVPETQPPATEIHPAVLSGPTTTALTRATFVLAPGSWTCRVSGTGATSNPEPCQSTYVINVRRDGVYTLKMTDAVTGQALPDWTWTVQSTLVSARGFSDLQLLDDASLDGAPQVEAAPLPPASEGPLMLMAQLLALGAGVAAVRWVRSRRS